MSRVHIINIVTKTAALIGYGLLSLICILTAVLVFYDIASVADSVDVSNSSFGVSIALPVNWNYENEEDKNSYILDAANDRQTGALTLVVVDLLEEYPLEDFIDWIEPQIAKELPFVTAERREKADAPLGDDLKMDFNEYQGRIRGDRVLALAGYRVDSNIGYLLLTVRGAEDDSMKEVLDRAVASFRTNH